jgi:hypothetical protein
MKTITNTDKRKAIIGITIIVLLAFGYRLAQYFVLKSNNVNYSYEGIITDKYYDSTNKHLPVIKVQGYREGFLLLNYKYFEIINIGDFIIKKKGTIEYVLIHDNDTMKFDPEL